LSHKLYDNLVSLSQRVQDLGILLDCIFTITLTKYLLKVFFEPNL